MSSEEREVGITKGAHAIAAWVASHDCDEQDPDDWWDAAAAMWDAIHAD